MSIKSNDKVSRSLSAILSGSDEEVVANTNESVACGDEAEQVEKEVEDAPAETAGAEEEPEEIEEITEEEVEAARKDAEDSSDDEDDDEPEEISDDEGEEEPELDEEQNDDGEVVEEDEDDEPIAEEDVEEITDEEVESARKEMEDEEEDDEDPEEITDEEDDSVEDVMDEDSSDDEDPEEITDDEDEDSEEPDEDATAEAVSALAKLGFGCSIDNNGKISVTACGEQPAEKEEVEGCDCGSKDCPECNKEEEASVTIRPVDAEEKVQADEVCSVLTGADTASPFYTVLIKGMPVAAIHLEDQPNAEAIRAYFLSNDYPTKLASAMSVSGVKNVLDTQHAKMFSAVASKSELAETMKAEAKAEAKAEFDKQLSEAIISTASKFANALKVAVAGMNKNFFTEPNDLKGAIYAAFAAEGKDENVAQAKTESIIAEAGSFFDTAIAKAQELMSKSDEAFAEVSEMIAKAGVAARATKTFANALEQGNNQIIAGVMGSEQHSEEQAEQATASAVSLLKTKKLFARR